MQIIDLNKTREIGSHCLYVELGKFNILLDCGMSPKEEGFNALPDFSLIKDKLIDVVILTHCHLDHLGSLPYFMKKQQQARVLTSAASRIIIPRILENSLTIMTMQREERGIKEYPLYHAKDVRDLDQHILTMANNKTRILQKDDDELEITFFSAGHVLGASSVLFTHKKLNVFFTGDVLFRDQKTLKGASWPKKKVDIVVTETTRGDTARKKDSNYQLEIDKLLAEINRTLSDGGSVLIPAFALGRMQEILKILHIARGKNKFPKNVPIFCSGLGLGLIEDFDRAARKLSCVDFGLKILRDLRVKSFRRAKFDQFRRPSKPSVFIVSSGMLVEHTPSYTTAANLLGEPQNSILFVGYCDSSTPGGELLESEQHSDFHFKAIDFSTKVEAHIERFDLSGHADREDLLNSILRLNPRNIVLTHGEPEARKWFFDTIVDEHPEIIVLDPEPGRAYEI